MLLCQFYPFKYFGLQFLSTVEVCFINIISKISQWGTGMWGWWTRVVTISTQAIPSQNQCTVSYRRKHLKGSEVWRDRHSHRMIMHGQRSFNKPSWWQDIHWDVQGKGQNPGQEVTPHSTRLMLNQRKRREKKKCVTDTKLMSSYLQWLCEYEGESPVEHMFQNGNTGCLNWINMAATSPPATPTQLHSPAALGLPHKAAGTGTNRLFIVQQKQVGM